GTCGSEIVMGLGAGPPPPPPPPPWGGGEGGGGLSPPPPLVWGGFFFASFLGAGASLALSPSPISVAIGALTFTPSVPAATRIFPILPSSTASNSIVALSVLISATMAPDLTVWPS